MLALSPVDRKRYQSLTGARLYLAICARPDTSFSIYVLVLQLHAPTDRHLFLAKRVVRYVYETANRKILYPKSRKFLSLLIAFADVDRAGCENVRRSTTGILIKVSVAFVF